MGCGSSTAAPVSESEGANRPVDKPEGLEGWKPQAGEVARAQGDPPRAGESERSSKPLSQEEVDAALREELPVGWQAKLDPESGEIYYVNHTTQTTSWDKPKMSDSELRARWSCKVDLATGLKYYEDHLTKTTQWDPPPGFVETDRVIVA
uniref:WW domain-containing protein n=1 Tax=Hemiselmis andersenii TaxID=464988 RepID=A0A6U2BQM6_HEMAN|mmetsp:Transcript_24586/g.59583  ORF Transcript_24586/g.59583 Transcript_24586/m.59583 type:complete len:150 (+) Transcript_24586:86-535(+)